MVHTVKVTTPKRPYLLCKNLNRIRIMATLKKKLNELKVTERKFELEEGALSKLGNKNDLAERIEPNA